jgi:acetolactate synthase-1/2/3 large subunit
MNTRQNGAQLLARALEAEGVDRLFGYPGGAIMPFYDALTGSKLKHILVRHEQGAALAANGYARASGRVGVCIATSGPGASNLVTGIADAFLDSAPMVVITGQVSTALMGTDAFQELDVFGMTLPIVKHSFLLRHVDDLPEVVHEAFRIAREGRPGPVLIDLPKDVQLADASHLSPKVPAAAASLPPPSRDSLAAAIKAIEAAERPVIYGGGGIALAEAVNAFRGFVDSSGIPTVLTLRGLGALPTGHPLLLGMLGMHGCRAANMAVQEADLLIVVSARFDDRATGKLAEFAPRARIVHLDADRREIGKLRHADVGVPGDVAAALKSLTGVHPDCGDWRQHCLEQRERHAARYDAPGRDVYAPALLRRLSEIAPRDAIVACDVGQHQMWVAQHWKFSHPRNHLTSGALGTMGFGLPAAIGAQFACPNRTVVLVSGDGSFMMNLQELATVARCRLPIKMVLLDNQALGMVRQWQELFFDRNYSEVDLSDNPDFAALARVFGIPALQVDQRADVEDALHALMSTPGPAFLHVAIDARSNVWPLVPPNHSNATMLEGEPAAVEIAATPEPAHALPA